MSEGRTYWYSEDASYVHRGLIVTLGTQYGAAVLAALQVLKGEAKHQNEGGRVLSAFSTVSRNGFINDEALTRRIVESAAALGVLDDLEILHDGVRFRCRISGWTADQDRANAADRQRKHRDSHGVSRCVTVRNENRTEQNRDNDSLRSSFRRENDEDDGRAAHHPSPRRPDPDEGPLGAAHGEAPLCHLLADLLVANGVRRPRVGERWMTAERLLLDRDKRDRSEAERLIRWCQADSFWRANVLSMSKFREKYDQLRLQSQRSAGSTTRESPSDLIRAIQTKGEARRELG